MSNFVFRDPSPHSVGVFYDLDVLVASPPNKWGSVLCNRNTHEVICRAHHDGTRWVLGELDLTRVSTVNPEVAPTVISGTVSFEYGSGLAVRGRAYICPASYGNPDTYFVRAEGSISNASAGNGSVVSVGVMLASLARVASACVGNTAGVWSRGLRYGPIASPSSLPGSTSGLPATVDAEFIHCVGLGSAAPSTLYGYLSGVRGVGLTDGVLKSSPSGGASDLVNGMGAIAVESVAVGGGSLGLTLRRVHLVVP